MPSKCRSYTWRSYTKKIDELKKKEKQEEKKEEAAKKDTTEELLKEIRDLLIEKNNKK